MLSFARVRAIAIVTVMIIVAVVLVFRALERDEDLPVEAEGCPEGFVPADLTLRDARDIRINVDYGTDQVGLANQVGENFANRGCEVREDEVAVPPHGPAAVGGADVLQAYSLHTAVSPFQVDGGGDVVGVGRGPGSRPLAPGTEGRQAIAGSGNPQLPAGTCPADAV